MDAGQKIARAPANACPGQDIHGIGDAGAHAVCEIGLDDCRHDGRFFPSVHCSASKDTRSIHEITVASNAGERFLDALEAADRHVELLANRRIGTGNAGSHFHSSDGKRRQRDRTSSSEAFHQHAPTLTGAFLPANDTVERHKDVKAKYRAVWKSQAERIMTLANDDSLRVPGNECAGHTDALRLAEQPVWIMHIESQADHGRYRGERD